jgi:zinc protease
MTSLRGARVVSRILGAMVFAAACAKPPAVAPSSSALQGPSPVEPAKPSGVDVRDPLGLRPEPSAPRAYEPPVPVQFAGPNGLKVWLLERHSMPIVSMQLVVNSGSASDPEGQAGLAFITAQMLDEGAGKRDAVALSQELDRLGAHLRTGAESDYSFVHVTALKKNLTETAALFSDVVTQPRFAERDWKRAHDLWQNELRARQSDPALVADVVLLENLFPAGHPYAHPSDGTLRGASKIGLPDARRFYATHWRPAHATLVVVGDVSRQELEPLAARAFGAWGPSGETRSTEPVDSVSPHASGRRVVLVDRPEAPQSVIAVARRSIAASNEDRALLARVNVALGGSFTSRLNQDLREEHGWTYGARSNVSFSRLPGGFVAHAAVQTEHTGEALDAMLKDIAAVASQGLTDAEVEKTSQILRAELVESFETASAASRRLGRAAGVRLAPDFDASWARMAMRAQKADLARVASLCLDLSHAVMVVVGPKASVLPQLAAIGIRDVVLAGAETR